MAKLTYIIFNKVDVPVFRTFQSYQNHLRKGGDFFDYVKIQKYIFTMDEYDMNGQEITYGNVKHQKTMFVKTEDRYKSKKDAEVTIAASSPSICATRTYSSCTLYE